MAYRTATGFILRNPAEKAKRYARQIKSGVIRETGQKLTHDDMVCRAGYLDHQRDCNKAFRAKHPRYKRKTK